MTPLKIWYVNHYGGGPGIGQAYRPFNLAKAWKSQGHEVAVITASFHHLLNRTQPLPDHLNVEGVPYYFLQARTYQGNGTLRLLNMMDFASAVARLANQRPKGLFVPDAIIASSPHPFAVVPSARLARKFGSALVFEIRDIWPLSITELAGASRYHPFVMLCAIAERFACRNADLIASLLGRADQYLATKGFGTKPFVWVPNGVNLTTSLSETTVDATANSALALIREWKSEGRRVIVHAGSMGPPNGLIELLDALETNRAKINRDRFAVLLVGSGSLEKEISKRADQSSCTVGVIGRIPKESVHTILLESDIGYCGLPNHEELYRYGVSLNKFGDYMRANLPCLLPIAPCGDPVSTSGAGIAVSTKTPEQLWQALEKLIDLSDAERANMNKKAEAYLREEYDMAKIAKRYAGAIAKVRPKIS